MNQTIINTGKVKIGSEYRPPARIPYMDADALKLQKALICKRQIDWDAIEIVIFTAGALALIFGVIA